MNRPYFLCFSVSQCTHGENWHLGEICVFFMECDGGWYARGLGGTTILFFCEKKAEAHFRESLKASVFSTW